MQKVKLRINYIIFLKPSNFQSPKSSVACTWQCETISHTQRQLYAFINPRKYLSNYREIMENSFQRRLGWWGQLWTQQWTIFKLRMKQNNWQNCFWKSQSCCRDIMYSESKYPTKSPSFVQLPPPLIKVSTELELNWFQQQDPDFKTHFTQVCEWRILPQKGNSCSRT